jgi:hypothetical protein
MSAEVIAVIKGIGVVQEDDDRVHWVSGAAVDADGADGQNGNPFAYRADDTGLDLLKNAGWPSKSWRDVLIEDPHQPGDPTSDGNGNWYSSTTYCWKHRPLATRYVDATTVPYVVVNPHVRIHARGIVIGARARLTYNGSTVDAVVADVSGPNDIGELSIAAAQALGFQDSSPRHGGVAHGVFFEIWPGQPATINGETYELQPA